MGRFVSYLKSKSYKGWRIAILALLLALFMGRFIVWGVVQSTNNQAAMQSFSAIVDSDVSVLRNRFEIYADTLYSGQALFATDKTISRADWSKFVDTQNIPERYPGINGIAYVSVISRNQSANLITQMNASRLPTDPKSFSIYPASTNSQLAVLTYLAPDKTDQTSIGYDLYTNAVRKQTLDLAQDNGTPQASPPLTLLSDPANAAPSLLLVMPVYSSGATPSTVAERRAELKGFVEISLHTQPMFDSIFSTAVNNTIAVTATSNGTSLYKFGTVPKNSLQESVDVNIAGQLWHFTFDAPSDFSLSASAKSAQNVIMYSSIPFAILLAMVFYYGIRLEVMRRHHELHHRKLQNHNH